MQLSQRREVKPKSVRKGNREYGGVNRSQRLLRLRRKFLERLRHKSNHLLETRLLLRLKMPAVHESCAQCCVGNGPPGTSPCPYSTHVEALAEACELIIAASAVVTLQGRFPLSPLAGTCSVKPIPQHMACQTQCWCPIPLQASPQSKSGFPHTVSAPSARLQGSASPLLSAVPSR